MPMTKVFHKDVFDRIPAEKQGRILDVAAREFAMKGLSAANINRIADRAGISIGSLYKYFESKTDLYLEVVESGLALLEKALGPILDSDEGLEEKIDAILDALIRGTEDYPLMNRLYIRFTSESDEDLTQRLSSRLETITARAYTALISQAQAEGILETIDDPGFLAFEMDNIFLTLQFSLTSGYWENRMKIYLGADFSSRKEELKTQAAGFLHRALGIRR